jgi:hypothetical protein
MSPRLCSWGFSPSAAGLSSTVQPVIPTRSSADAKIAKIICFIILFSYPHVHYYNLDAKVQIILRTAKELQGKMKNTLTGQ